jgi:hypothetical protein
VVAKSICRSHRLIAIDKSNILVSGEPFGERLTRNATGRRLAKIKNGYLHAPCLPGYMPAGADRHA